MSKTTIDPSVFKFLKDVSKNNNREWFAKNKPRYQDAYANVKLFADELLNEMSLHDEIELVKLYRIYRDVRFSKNKLPYKTHFGGSFARKKPELRGGYYLHIQPNNESFIATGFWDPNKEDLLRIRKEFEMDDSEMRDILANKKFKSTWGNFVGDELKTAPKGFDKEHEAIKLIRHKQFIFVRNFTDKEVLSKDFLKVVDESFNAIRPYFDLMSSILTTNLNGESLIG